MVRKNTLAFFIRVEITKGKNGNEVLPVLYDDNYVTLFPSESIDIVAKYKKSALKGASAYVKAVGYNVSEQVVELGPGN